MSEKKCSKFQKIQDVLSSDYGDGFIFTNGIYTENDSCVEMGIKKGKRVTRLKELFVYEIEKAECAKKRNNPCKVCDCIIIHYDNEYYVILTELKSKSFKMKSTIEQINSTARKVVRVFNKIKETKFFLYGVIVCQSMKREESMLFDLKYKKLGKIRNKSIQYLHRKTPMNLDKFVSFLKSKDKSKMK